MYKTQFFSSTMDLSNHCIKIKTLAQLRYPKYITYLNKIPHVYQVCLISCTTGIWRSPQVRLNLVTSKLHETWASQVHAIHSQVNSKCTKYKLLSTSTIRFATQKSYLKERRQPPSKTWLVLPQKILKQKVSVDTASQVITRQLTQT